jgi:chromosome partitioning protein
MIITVAHTKGGVGKSTLAWNLTHSFMELGKNVTIIDLDFQQTLYFLNAMGGGTLTVLQPQSVSELLEVTKADDDTDIFIIDVGGFDNDINRAAVDIAHKVLIPISDSVTEILGFKTFEGILQNMLLQERDLRVVLNNIHPLTKNFDTIKEALGDSYKLMDSIVRSRKIYKTTLGAGASVFDTRDEALKNEIRAVRDELSRT